MEERVNKMLEAVEEGTASVLAQFAKSPISSILKLLIVLTLAGYVKSALLNVFGPARR